MLTMILALKELNLSITATGWAIAAGMHREVPVQLCVQRRLACSAGDIAECDRFF
jgi:hypothetical protein